ncbi:hypothetical protein LIER_00456 [Lithospermum erythrorhizon]|uniref:Scarecrow-like protein 14 n=1 Tax=Lithospermum erythrorhizon TaxID=34254 RepID=A0AAV3NHE3_LITER
MNMDSHLNTLPDSFDDFKFFYETPLPSIEQFVDDPLYIDSMHNHDFLSSADFRVPDPSLNASTGVNYPDDHATDPVQKFLNQILLEESMEDKPSMFHDPLALQATEKSLYDAIGRDYPISPALSYPTHVDVNAAIPDSIFGSTSGNSTTSSSSGGSFVGRQWNVDPGGIILPVGQSQPSIGSAKSSLSYSQPLDNSINSCSSSYNGQIDPSPITNLVPRIYSDSESLLKLQKGTEETMKFLPTNNQLNINFDQNTLPPKSEKDPPEVVVKKERDKKDNSPSFNRGRKHLHRQDSQLEGQRSRKQSAIYEEEVELSDWFDKVLLCDVGGFCSSKNANYRLHNRVGAKLESNESHKVVNNGKGRSKKLEAKTDVVDLRTILANCAQAVATDDHRTVNEQLKKIREHASSTGDTCQRLANVFSNGIEARLAGTGRQIYATLASKKITAVEKLKAYQVYLSACPFKTIAIYFANEMILKTAAKASTLHIVDFGILYGFQYPMLIHMLSSRPGGPPKLRITGIEFPQSGFRPAEMVEETGHRLAKYCERFNVPFEYQAIASKSWEKININDLKLARDEVLAVNCHFRFKNLLDETVVEDSPRDVTLNLIRKMKPDIFVQASVNASFNSPFFLTRFREALFYYSSLFDMLDVTLPRDDQQRFNFENEFYRREVVNIIACEGPERVERPETYKQWQCRNMRAGFKLLPLDKEIVKKLKGKVEAGFHKDFIFDDDRNWMLQGWKGRILYASSCWVPG